MDVRKCLFLIVRDGNWIDKTSEIDSISANGNLYSVKFSNISKPCNDQK